MFMCIINDIMNILQFFPLAIFVGAAVYVISHFTRKRFKGCGTLPGLSDLWHGFLAAYLVMLFQIVFFSREAGSRMALNLVIGGTWTDDLQGRAYVIENILLFIPFGMLVSLNWRRIPLIGTALIGFGLSLGIEFLQLATARGYFQVDDLIMNTLGCLLGGTVVWIVRRICVGKGGQMNEKKCRAEK